MKPSASRIERMLAKVEARLVPPPRYGLFVPDVPHTAHKKSIHCKVPVSPHV
jgi:hypothetical protein